MSSPTANSAATAPTAAAALAPASTATDATTAPPSTTAAVAEADERREDELYLSEVAYAKPVDTTGAPTISTLPPIATARPMTGYTHGHGHAPIVHQVPVVAATPSAWAGQDAAFYQRGVEMPVGAFAARELVPADASPSSPFFEHMAKCRYAAVLLLCYYVVTMFFFQPFFVGTLGAVTGILGVYGSRAPIYAIHIKWLRGFLWLNYFMLAMNLWYLVVIVAFFNQSEQYEDPTVTSSGGVANASAASADGTETETASLQFYEQQVGFVICVIIAANMMLHINCLRAGKRFLAELMRSPSLPLQRTVVIVRHDAV